MASSSGAELIARTLRELGVTVMFGIVGVPVTDIAEHAINLGIRFIGFRNEQAASYAASVYGYLTKKPGVCLVVGGPGVVHAIAGVRQYIVSYVFSCPKGQFSLTVLADQQRPKELLPFVSARWVNRDFRGQQRRLPGNGCDITSQASYQIRDSATEHRITSATYSECLQALLVRATRGKLC
jgi:hypothetical protein